MKTSGRFFILTLGMWAATASAPDSARAAFLPPALAELRDFRGRIDYMAHRDGQSQAIAIHGTLVGGDHGWMLDERTARYQLHADDGGSYLQTGAGMAAVNDVFESDVLANPWAAALGIIAVDSIEQGGTAGVWSSRAGIRVYVDSSGARLVGIADAAGRNQISYVLDNWTRSGPLAVPQHILRLRMGIPDASYSIDQYVVVPAPPSSSGGQAKPIDLIDTLVGHSGSVPLSTSWWPAADAAARLESAALASALAFAMFVVAWTRRDAWMSKLCRRLSRDPRGWQRAGVSIFVGPDGALHFDGMRYRVGPHYYNRAALVQCSVLFVRVSAPGVSYPVVLPRRFRPIDLGIRPRADRKLSPGFTLVETLMATALFAAVVMLCIYPALAALSRADALAQERAQAVVVASNVLADEEIACAYGRDIPTGSQTSTIDGYAVTVTVEPGERHEDTLAVRVADAAGNGIVDVSTLLGPPVKAPQ